MLGSGPLIGLKGKPVRTEPSVWFCSENVGKPLCCSESVQRQSHRFTNWPTMRSTSVFPARILQNVPPGRVFERQNAQQGILAEPARPNKMGRMLGHFSFHDNLQSSKQCRKNLCMVKMTCPQNGHGNFVSSPCPSQLDQENMDRTSSPSPNTWQVAPTCHHFLRRSQYPIITFPHVPPTFPHAHPNPTNMGHLSHPPHLCDDEVTRADGASSDCVDSQPWRHHRQEVPRGTLPPAHTVEKRLSEGKGAALPC